MHGKIIRLSYRSSLRTRPADGFALVAVLWISVVISGVLLTATYIARLETRKAYYPLREIQALGIAVGGVEAAKASVASERESYTSLNQKWKTSDELYRSSTLGEGTLDVVVEDEESKINLNSFPQNLLAKFRPFQLAGNTGELIESLVDWRDWDSSAGANGGEEDYYRFLSPPRHCKNAPLDCLDELNVIKGFNESSLTKRISAIMTVYSNGKINVNTAPPEVLAALPGMDDRTALSLVAHRSGRDCVEGTMDDQPFKSVDELREFLGNDIYSGLWQYVDCISDTFKVRSSGTVGNITKTVEAVLIKRGQTVKIRSWREL